MVQVGALKVIGVGAQITADEVAAVAACGAFVAVRVDLSSHRGFRARRWR
jgi:hypothetical protein